MYDLGYLVRRLVARALRVVRPSPASPSPLPHHPQTSPELERLEPRIVLSASPTGLEQVDRGETENAIDSSGLWQPIDAVQMAAAEGASTLSLAASKSFSLDQNLLAQRLTATPLEFSDALGSTLTLPSPAGGFEQFSIWESPIMAPELAAKFPNIETFVGRGIDDPTASVRLDFTPQGFHAQVLSSQGTYFVDPFFHQQADGPYVSYFKTDCLLDADDAFECLLHDVGIDISQDYEASGDHAGGCCCPDCAITVSADNNTDRSAESATDQWTLSNNRIGPLLSHGTQLRTYDLAVACTGEYTAYHGGTVEGAMSAIVTTMNRDNGIYETDIATRMILVANNDQLVYTDGSTDPYSNNDGFSMLSENQSNVDSVIGDANYDIGHVFSTGGGGVAGLGVIGDSGSKARGVTGQGSPIGDPFDVDYVAHELGHQFGANHTFNGNNGNRNASTAMEPGSASTIMGYAGIMGSDNLQSNSDPYFHSVSLDEMVAEITNGNANAAATITNTGNSVPTVDAGADYTIPAATPFVLTATGSDADAGDTLTYTWEQRDLGAQQGVNDGDNGASPLFRSWNPTTSPERVFPRYSDLLAGTTAIGETLPTTNRDMNFRVVVRDNRAGGAAFNTDDMLVTVIDTGSPFQVTTGNSAVSWTGGSIETVSWDVAGTNTGSINVATVDILISTDGGSTFSTIAAGIANDGSQNITVPNTPTSQARLKVQAVGNIFFDISDSDFTITAGGPGVSVAESEGSTNVSENGDTDTYELSLQTVPAAAVEITLSADAQSEVSIDGVNFASTAVFSRTDTTAQTVTVRAVDDSSQEGNHTSTISHAITNSGDTTDYPTSMTIDSVTATIADNDVPGITLTETDEGTSVSEDGATDTYAIALDSVPAGAVQITVTADTQSEVSGDGVNFAANAVFNFSDTTAQTVTVRAVDDAAEEGNHTSALSHAVTSTADAANYPLTFSIDDLTVNVVDNDLTALVGIDFDTTGGTAPNNWTQINSFTAPYSQSNLINEDGTATAIDVTLSVSDGTGFLAEVVASTLPTHDQSLSGLDGEIYTSSDPVTATFSDLTPGGNYEIYVFGLENYSSYVNNQRVTITGAGTATVFDQTLTAGNLYINSEQGDSGRSLSSFAETIIADSSGQIAIAVTPNTGTSDLSLGGLAIRPLSGGGLLALAIADEEVTETDGAAATNATVTRTGSTSGDLVVTLTSSDTTEATVPATVTIPDGQSSVTFEIAAIDDSDVDGTQTVTITAEASGLASGSDTLNVTDDDVPLVLSVAIADASVAENGGATATTATVTRTGPTSGDLIVSLTSSDTSEATVPSTVTIPDGQSSATFDIAAIDDSDVDGTQTVTIAATASEFTGGSDTLDVTDDDIPLVLSVAIADASVAENAGTAATTATVTRTDASGDLVVTLTSDDTSEATVPGTVTILDGQSSATFDIAAVDD
ncbi:MAG: zinc-dependent metalloprotease family protein, partial [Planctomycetota bacterium]|nr:zinc-dependent metalloprotease family protein [Planctomycetota bacterium]